jgi:uncharacterized membrane protein YuzA (DUF378 family)
MKVLYMTSGILTVIGGINWGLVGLGTILGGKNFNLVNLLLGSWPTVEAIVYLLVGVSAVMMLSAHMGKKCSCCMDDKK